MAVDELAMIRGVNGAYFVYTDANWNVIGLTTPAGRLAEEYNYTPYGRLIAKRHTAFGDSNGDGDVDVADKGAWLATQGPMGTYNRNLDANYDGLNNAFDSTAFYTAYNAPGTSVEVSGRAWSPSGNPYGYTARRLDPETMLMHYRRRTYSPTLKQFIQRDPLRYVDGPNLYQYVVGNPLRYVDPWGLRAPTAHESTWINAAIRIINQVMPWIDTSGTVEVGTMPRGRYAQWDNIWYLPWDKGLITVNENAIMPYQLKGTTIDELMQSSYYGLLELAMTLAHEFWHMNHDPKARDFKEPHNEESWDIEAIFLINLSMMTNDNKLLAHIWKLYNMILTKVHPTFRSQRLPKPPRSSHKPPPSVAATRSGKKPIKVGWCLGPSP